MLKFTLSSLCKQTKIKQK